VDEAELTFVDRMRTPKQPEFFAALTPAIQTVLDALYGRDNYTLTQASSDPRQALAIQIKAHRPGATIAGLLARTSARSGSNFAPAIAANGAAAGQA
jgi:hypothetical protein